MNILEIEGDIYNLNSFEYLTKVQELTYKNKPSDYGFIIKITGSLHEYNYPTLEEANAAYQKVKEILLRNIAYNLMEVKYVY